LGRTACPFTCSRPLNHYLLATECPTEYGNYYLI
jgi:hypothetical protein